MISPEILDRVSSDQNFLIRVIIGDKSWVKLVSSSNTSQRLSDTFTVEQFKLTLTKEGLDEQITCQNNIDRVLRI